MNEKNDATSRKPVPGVALRRLLDKGQVGFLQHEILSRVWIKGTLRMKELSEQIMKEVIDAFCARYPQDSDKCTFTKIKRMFCAMRPSRLSTHEGALPRTSVVFEYKEPVKRHAAFSALQEQAVRTVDRTKQLLSDAHFNASSPELAEHVATLSNLHHEFEEWCAGFGKDLVVATDTRNSLRVALKQMNDAIAGSVGKELRDEEEQEEAVKESVSDVTHVRKSQTVSFTIYQKQIPFLKKAADIVKLHAEFVKQLHTESKQNDSLVKTTPAESCDELASLVDTADSIRELEKEISSSEKALQALYEKKSKFSMPVMVPMHKRAPKFLGFFLLPDGKVRHFSVGLDNEKGDESVCNLLRAKHGYAKSRTGKLITHYTPK